MNPPREVARCHALLVGLSRKLGKIVAVHQHVNAVPRSEIAPLATEWQSLPQAIVRIVPTTNAPDAHLIGDLRRLTTVIRGVTERFNAILREYRDEIPVEVLGSFKAELDRVPL